MQSDTNVTVAEYKGVALHNFVFGGRAAIGGEDGEYIAEVCKVCQRLKHSPTHDMTKATNVESATIDSGVIDNRLLIATNEWYRAEIAKAKWSLQRGLRIRHTQEGERFLNDALKILSRLIRD